jgi:hypothetical protein
MTYRVVKDFRVKGVIHQAGSQIELSDYAAGKLAGFVQPVAADPITTFEQSGDPVSCLYWFQVCWAVQLYQGQCTRSTDCRVYKFLKRQDAVD